MYEHANIIALSTIFLIIIPILVYNWQRRHLYYYASKIPGPFALPIIGNAQLFFFQQKNFLQVLVDQINSYPSVCKAWLGPHLYIVTSRPQDAEIVLNTFLEKANCYQYLNEMLKNSLISAPVNVWKKNRKFLNHTFNSKITSSFHDTFVKRSKSLVKTLESVCGKEETDLVTKVWEHSLSAAIETLFDLDPDNVNSLHELIQWIIRAEQITIERIHTFRFYLNPIWKMSALHKEDTVVAAKLNTFVQNIIDDKLKVLKNFDADKKQRFFNYMLDAEQRNEHMTREQIIQESVLMLTASSETMASVVTSVMVVLGIYPEIQEKVYKEVLSVIENDTDITLDAMKKLNYLERVIKETLRLLPPLPFAIRFLDKNIDSDPYVFPAGCNMYIPIMQIHRNPEFWPDPFNFDPDRFLPEEIKKRHRYAYIPFSVGARNCIGLQYAMMQMKCFVANIVKKIKITTLDHKSVETIEFEFHIITKPKGYRVLLEKREKF